MNKKQMWILLGSASGVVAIGAGAYALWNSKRVRMMRNAKRAGKILYKVGAVMQAASEAMD